MNGEPSATDDRELVDRARDGDRRAFEALYRRHAGRVHALCWRLAGGDEPLAQDLTQEAFIRAWRKLDGFRGDSAFGTWLHRVAVNVALGDRRLRVRTVDREVPMDHAPEPGRSEDRGGEIDLEAAISRLPERARSVFVLHAVEGYGHREIAALTGMAEGSSKAQLHRARQLLRSYLAS